MRKLPAQVSEGLRAGRSPLPRLPPLERTFMMCRYDTKLFDAQTTQTRAARRWVVAVLRRWQLDALSEELELVCSELVTNALLHTRSGFDVTLAACSGSVELAVRDRDPRQPVMRPARPDLLADIDRLIVPSAEGGQPEPYEQPDVEQPDVAERHSSLHVGPAGSIAAGRGLVIVDAIADEWGVASHANGKDVWMRLPIPAQWPYLHDCTCDERDERTPSGHPISHLAGEWDVEAIA